MQVPLTLKMKLFSLYFLNCWLSVLYRLRYTKLIAGSVIWQPLLCNSGHTTLPAHFRKKTVILYLHFNLFGMFHFIADELMETYTPAVSLRFADSWAGQGQGRL